MLTPFFLVIFFSGLVSFFVLAELVPRLTRIMPDYPNERSSHSKATPRGGGISFVFIAIICSAVSLLFGQGDGFSIIPLLAAPLAAVGLFDDRYDLPASWRYCVQVLTAILMLGFSPLLSQLGLSVSSASWYYFGPYVFILITATAVINFINFMDGLDGLVAGCMAVSILAVSFQINAPWSIWALSGSLLGFLFWNWSPAKVFMGDVGSTFLGAVFVGLVFQASNFSEAVSYLLVATPLLGDAFLCLLRRLLAGQKVFEAHRLHLFQRLHQAGWSHSRVSLTYIAATSFLAVAMLAGGWAWMFTLAAAELLIGVWLDQRVAVPFAAASRS